MTHGHKKKMAKFGKHHLLFWVCPGPIGHCRMLSWNNTIITKKGEHYTPLSLLL